jgi:hypothetical protein
MSPSENFSAAARSLKVEIRRFGRGVIRRGLRVLQKASAPVEQTQEPQPPLPTLLRRRVKRAGDSRIPPQHRFRVLFVGRPAEKIPPVCGTALTT